MRKTPNKAKFMSAEKISRIKNPLDWTRAKIRLMIDACREMAIFHARHSPEMGAIYKRYGFDPKSIRHESDLKRIPVIGVTAMKYFLLTSLPAKSAVLKLTSSGTSGQKTRIWFDGPSLDRVQAMLENLWKQEGLVSSEKANYVMFVYDPKEAKDLGIAFSDKNQQRFAPVAESFYAIRKDTQGAWQYRKDDTIAKLREFALAGKPVRLFGIPSFIYEIIQELDSRKCRIKLPSGSLMMTGGGWKAAEDKKVSREYFRMKIEQLLGLVPGRIRDGYGLAEHSAPYVECSDHKFHVPVYNRVVVRDPSTMQALPPGRTGLLELITPFNAMMPTLAILSTDMGYIEENKCKCGHSSPTFVLVGRGGVSKHKGCAIHASEVVKRG
ncbi:hypothetical protein ACFL6Y_05085 [Elusimicrobiota bacterium]